MASPNTVVMQYMVLFSHRTVRLPAHTHRQQPNPRRAVVQPGLWEPARV